MAYVKKSELEGGVEALARDIVANAAKEYIKACRKIKEIEKELDAPDSDKATLQKEYDKAVAERDECEEFFESKFFEEVSPMSKEALIKELKKNI